MANQYTKRANETKAQYEARIATLKANRKAAATQIQKSLEPKSTKPATKAELVEKGKKLAAKPTNAASAILGAMASDAEKRNPHHAAEQIVAATEKQNNAEAKSPKGRTTVQIIEDGMKAGRALTAKFNSSGGIVEAYLGSSKVRVKGVQDLLSAGKIARDGDGFKLA